MTSEQWSLTIPWVSVLTSNNRMHRFELAAAKKTLRTAALVWAAAEGWPQPFRGPVLEVTVGGVYAPDVPRNKHHDPANLIATEKAVTDGVADAGCLVSAISGKANDSAPYVLRTICEPPVVSADPKLQGVKITYHVGEWHSGPCVRCKHPIPSVMQPGLHAWC